MNLFNLQIKNITLIQIDKKFNYINTEGKLLSPIKWFDNCLEWNDKFNIGVVQDNKKGFNIIDSYGNILSSIWFEYITTFSNGMATVKLGNEYNYINTKGKLISTKWFKSCTEWDKEYNVGHVVIDNNKQNYIKTNGDFLYHHNFNHISCFYDGIAIAYNKEKGYALVNNKGEIFCQNEKEVWLEKCSLNDIGEVNGVLNGFPVIIKYINGNFNNAKCYNVSLYTRRK